MKLHSWPQRIIAIGMVILLSWGLCPSVSASESALALFQAAYTHRYTWDSNFPGFQAEVSLMVDNEQYHGLVQVDPQLQITVLNIEDDSIRELVEVQLGYEVTHRQRILFERVHGQNQFKQVETEPDGTAVIEEFQEGTLIARYKILPDGLIAQVNRTVVPNQLAVTVNTLTWLQSREGSIANHFQTEFQDLQTGNILERSDVRDTYQHIGPYYFLAQRQIRYGSELGPKQKPLPDEWYEFNSFLPLPPRPASQA